MQRLAFALFLTLLACKPATSLTFDARVVKIADGDSMTVRDTDGKRLDVRLSGIDAPEGRQTFGRESKASLERLLAGGQVRVEVVDVDPYGRMVSRVLHGGTDVALAQLEAGMAWTYPRAEGIAPAVKLRYAEAERKAKRSKAGLWRDPAPTPPWVFRRATRGDIPPAPVPRAAGPVIGNRNSKLYHLPHCPGYNATAPDNRVLFASPAEAEKAGYRRAGNCR